MNKRNLKRAEELKAMFFGLAENKKTLANPVIENLAFMEKQLNRLQERIDDSELAEEYQNRNNQKGIKQSASMQAYNSMMKNYLVLYSKLESLLMEAEKHHRSSVIGDE